jgi:hypothetical protein
MRQDILIGRGREMLEIPRQRWESGLVEVPDHAVDRLSFMTREHHLVREFVVKELPRVARPLGEATIAEALGLSGGQVRGILDDLEHHLFFLLRNEEGAVSWAYPVTVERTPHRLTFSTGERLHAA